MAVLCYFWSIRPTTIPGHSQKNAKPQSTLLSMPGGLSPSLCFSRYLFLSTAKSTRQVPSDELLVPDIATGGMPTGFEITSCSIYVIISLPEEVT